MWVGLPEKTTAPFETVTALARSLRSAVPAALPGTMHLPWKIAITSETLSSQTAMLAESQELAAFLLAAATTWGTLSPLRQMKILECS